MFESVDSESEWIDECVISLGINTIFELIHFIYKTIETVEQEVERLLEEDAKATQVRYGPFLHTCIRMIMN